MTPRTDFVRQLAAHHPERRGHGEMRRVPAFDNQIAAGEHAVPIHFHDQRPNQVRPSFVQSSNGRFQMIGKPQIVVIQVGKEAAARAPDGLIVWPRLVASVLRQIDKLDARIGDLANHIGRVVRARVAHDPHFRVRKRLAADGLYRESQHIAAVVRGGNYGNDGRSFQIRYLPG